MATQSISNAVVGGQDLGTGLSENVDPNSAGMMALYGARAGLSAFVVAGYGGGLGFVSHDAANDTVTVDTGLCFIVDDSTATSNERGSGGNVSVQPDKTGTKPWSYSHELAGNIVYPVEIRSQTTVDCTNSTLNQIWINITDLTTNNSVEIRSDGGGGTTAEPADTYLKLGEANPDDASADTRANDFESPIFRALELRGNLSDDQANTVYDYTNQRIGTDLADSTSVALGGGLADDSGSVGLDSVASGDATLSSGSVVVDTGHAINDTAEYTVFLNPDGGADIAASLEEGGTNYQLHLEENTTGVGNPTCRWRLVRFN